MAGKEVLNFERTVNDQEPMKSENICPHCNKEIEIENNKTRIPEYTKKAHLKYREKNREILNEKQRINYKKKKEKEKQTVEILI